MGRNFHERWMVPERHPISELSRIKDEMSGFLDNFFGKSEISKTSFEFIPSLDVSETNKEIIVKAELPGMSEKDIKISIDGDILTLRGIKEESKEEKGETFYRRERSSGSFLRRIQLPTSVNTAGVKAAFKDGLLSVKLPKEENGKNKEIEIEIGK